MSVSKVREVIVDSPVGKVLATIFAAAMVVTLFSTCNRSNAIGSSGQAKATDVAMTVGSTEITVAQVDEALKAGMAQMGGMDPSTLPATFQGQIYGQAINTLIQKAVVTQLTKDAGIRVTEASLLAALDKEAPKAKEQLKGQFVQQKLLKEGATDAEFDKVLVTEFEKQQSGRKITGWQNLLDDAKAELQKKVKDPVEFAKLSEQQAQQEWFQKLLATIPVNEADVKASFDEFEIKQITFDNKGEDKESGKKEAQTVLEEIKKGTSFEDAMEKHSKMPAEKGKKKSDASFPIPRSSFESMQELKSLGTLKAGEVSGVLTTPTGAGIYKVVKITPKVPADFDKQKQQYIDQFKQSKGNALAMQQVKDAEAKLKPNFKSKALELIYQYNKAGVGPMGAAASDAAKLTPLLPLGKEAIAQTGDPYRAAAAGTYMAIVQALRGQDKTKYSTEAIAALEAYTQANSTATAERVELAKEYALAKNANGFADVVERTLNDLKTDATGQSLFNDLTKEIESAEKSNLLTAAQVTSLKAKQESWKERKKIADEEEKKRAEFDKKLEDERKAKEAEELKKQTKVKKVN